MYPCRVTGKYLFCTCRLKLYIEEKIAYNNNIESDAGWSSLEARRAHNPKAAGSNPAPAIKSYSDLRKQGEAFLFY